LRHSWPLGLPTVLAMLAPGSRPLQALQAVRDYQLGHLVAWKTYAWR
jgi:hypothetical protein